MDTQTRRLLHDFLKAEEALATPLRDPEPLRQLIHELVHILLDDTGGERDR